MNTVKEAAIEIVQNPSKFEMGKNNEYLQTKYGLDEEGLDKAFMMAMISTLK